VNSLEPRQILAVGRSYAAHAQELGHSTERTSPLLFWKPVGSLAVDGVCRLPQWSEGPTRIDYEGEIALVLARDLGPGTPDLPPDPWEAVAGIAAGVDVSDRDLQKLEPRWVRAKGFHGACQLGPGAPRPDDPEALRVQTFKNGDRVQDGTTDLLLFPFRGLLRYLHGFLRLYAGDVILTGTPAGVGPVAPGDVVRVTVHAGEALLTECSLRFETGKPVDPFPRG
jgi:2-keto-4-pentenoate hydratase/2-oxohepta-3-ene-1,7-dioic acid hydratase in catechol pathway